MDELPAAEDIRNAFYVVFGGNFKEEADIDFEINGHPWGADTTFSTGFEAGPDPGPFNDFQLTIHLKVKVIRYYIWYVETILIKKPYLKYRTDEEWIEWHQLSVIDKLDDVRNDCTKGKELEEWFLYQINADLRSWLTDVCWTRPDIICILRSFSLTHADYDKCASCPCPSDAALQMIRSLLFLKNYCFDPLPSV